MSDSNPLTPAPDHLSALHKALDSGTFRQVREMLNTLPPAEIAHLIESSPPRSRNVLWALIEPDCEGDILQYLNDEVRAGFIRHMDTDALVAATEGLDVDDIADILQSLPEQVTRKVLKSMRVQDRQRIQQILSYDEDSAGGPMNTDTITVRPDVTLDVVLRYLRLRGDIPDTTDKLLVVDRQDKFIGHLALTDLLTCDPSLTVDSVMNRDAPVVLATLPANDVAQLFQRLDLISAAVIDNHGHLLGRITIDDVVDVIRDEADHSLLSMAGLDDDEDTFGNIISSTKRRAIWLGINLLTALLASTVISTFDAAIEKIVALAILMPIVASMGGIAGSQTLTLVIRGMALGHISGGNSRWLLIKESAVGLLNGLIWASILAAIAGLWFQDLGLGLVIAIAMLVNLLIAALAGVGLPLILQRLDIDPALAGSVILTTITDVVGFATFLGLASWLLL